jgi:polysaccharide biosynthesis/export protein ExoF
LRDKQRAEASLARAKATLEKADRDHAMLSLENGARISKELAAVEAEIARLTTAVEDSRGAVDGLEALAGQVDTVAYRIMRRDQSGRTRFISATESTPVMPDDVISIERIGEVRISPAAATR